MPMSAVGELNAVNLKQRLWETLNGVKSGKITAGSGDAVASQAREILRTVRTQLQIFSQSSQAVTQELIAFAKPESKASRRK